MSFWDTLKGGLGRFNAAAASGYDKLAGGLMPVDPAAGMTPDQIKALRNQGMMQLGLGMLAAQNRGAGLGQSLAAGVGGATEGFQGATQRAYQVAKDTQAQKRQEERDRIEREQYAKDVEFREKRLQADIDAATQEQDRYNEGRTTLTAWQKAQLEDGRAERAARSASTGGLGAPPSGYRWTPAGTLEAIPGGPQDPARTGVTPPVMSEDERRSAGLAVRMQNALSTIQEVGRKNPEAMKPGVVAATAGSIPGLGMVARNVANSSERQQVEAAQRDALDAALTLATGAAYTKEQLSGLLHSYFPQIGDTDATVAEKQKRFESVIETARIRAGRAEGTIDPLTQGASLPGGGTPRAPAGADYEYVPGQGLRRAGR